MRPGTTTRGSRASRRRACVPWRDGAKLPRDRSWSSCDCEIRASLSGDDGWVGMCASALQNCAPHWQKVSWGKPKVYRVEALTRNCSAARSLSHRCGTGPGLRCSVAIVVQIAQRGAFCTTSAATIFFCACNTREIKHSQFLSSRAAQSLTCAVDISC